MMVEVREGDLTDPVQVAGLVAVLDGYARGPEGQGAPLPAAVRAELVAGLRAQPTALTLLALAGDDVVGAAVCFWGYSTFAARPLLNVHDLAVTPAFRGRGVGRRLLDEVERRARARDCCKVTLEVHDTNARAKRLYRRAGFGPWDAPTLFVSKRL